MSNTDKLKALKLTIDKIDKDYGKGSVMMMGDKVEAPMEVISTGLLRGTIRKVCRLLLLIDEH